MYGEHYWSPLRMRETKTAIEFCSLALLSKGAVALSPLRLGLSDRRLSDRGLAPLEPVGLVDRRIRRMIRRLGAPAHFFRVESIHCGPTVLTVADHSCSWFPFPSLGNCVNFLRRLLAWYCGSGVILRDNNINTSS